jgi:hypothetical protein
MKALEDVSNGVKIFAFIETENAGMPQTQAIPVFSYVSNNFISSRWRPMFGFRQKDRRDYWW